MVDIRLTWTAVKRWTRLLPLFVLVVFGALALGGRDVCAQEPQTVTFDRAVEIAIEENTQIKRSENEVDLQSVRSAREWMSFAPDLQVSTSGTRSFGRSFSQEEGEILNETSDFFGLGADVSVNLFNGFEKFASVRQFNLEEEASSLRLTRSRERVVFQVIENFTLLLQDQQLAEVRQQELEVQRELLNQVRGLVDVGRQPKSDLFQQQAAVAEARVALEQARRQIELDKSQLIDVLELDPRREYVFEGPSLRDSLADTTSIDRPAYEFDRLMERAFDRRTDLEALQTGVVAAEQQMRVARSGYWPSLSLSFGYGSDWSSTARRVADQQPGFVDQLDARRGGSIRLSLSFPIFDRYQTRTNVREAEVQLQNARYDLQDQRQQVALQIRQAVLDYRSATSELSAAFERLEAARRARQAARRRYELGGATFVEVAQANSDYVSARAGRVRARYDVLLARKLIEYYSGTLDVRDPRFP